MNAITSNKLILNNLLSEISDASEHNTDVAEIVTTAIGVQRDITILQAIEVCKQMCPPKVSRGCANLLHKRETKTTRCDGDCARVKYFVNGLNKQEL